MTEGDGRSGRFELRFPLDEVEDWSARYPADDDTEVEMIGRHAAEQAFYTREQFLAVMRWKSARPGPMYERNTERDVRIVTELALSTPDERRRIECLLDLSGVSYPTASVLLHLAHRDPYPILDVRALWSLGLDEPPAAFSTAFWREYTDACRALAERAGVSMRTLDRALWQYAKECQPGPGRRRPKEIDPKAPEPKAAEPKAAEPKARARTARTPSRARAGTGEDAPVRTRPRGRAGAELEPPPQLRALVEAAAAAPPESRIEYRDRIAAFGLAAIVAMREWVEQGRPPGLAIGVIEAVGRSGERSRAAAALRAVREQCPDWASVADAAIKRL